MSLTIRKYIEGVIGPYVTALVSAIKLKANIIDIPKTPSVDVIVINTMINNTVVPDFSASGKVKLTVSSQVILINTPIIPPSWSSFSGTIYITSNSPGGTNITFGQNVVYIGGDGTIIMPNTTMRLTVDVNNVSGTRYAYISTAQL